MKVSVRAYTVVVCTRSQASVKRKAARRDEKARCEEHLIERREGHLFASGEVSNDSDLVCHETVEFGTTAVPIVGWGGCTRNMRR